MATTVTLKPNAIDISGSTSGTTTLQATAVAGTTTITLPAATDTLVGKATTDTLTNKTLTSPTITGGALNGTLGATTPSTVEATTISASGTTTLSGNQIISVTDNTNAALRITQLGTGNALLVEDSTNPDATPFVIDASGNVVVGATSLMSGYGSMQVLGTSGLLSAVGQFSADATGAIFSLNKSRNTTIGSPATIVASGDTLGQIRFYGADGTNFIRGAAIEAAVDGTPGTSDMPGRLVFSTTADGASTPTERMRIDSSGKVGIGTTSPTSGLNLIDALSGGQLLVATNQTNATEKYGTYGTQHYTNAEEPVLGIGVQSNATDNNILIGGALGEFNAATQVRFYTAANNTTVTGTERMRIDSSGNVGIGTTSPSYKLDVQGTTANQRISSTTGTNAAYQIFSNTGQNFYVGLDNSAGNQLLSAAYGATLLGTGAYPMVFGTNNAERMRIDSSGNLLVGKSTFGSANVGTQIESSGVVVATRNSNVPFISNRTTNDGSLFSFRQDDTEEGSISVSGTTVSYNGGHLSRYAQTTTAKDETLVKGTVLSNLDAMNVYTDADGNPVANEQLNKVKVSDTEGDANVAGVFVNWSYDEAHQVDEINMAMTGDMIIRIAQGVTVQRGDLLMSAGDGTAKPQSDDIVRSKTIAKVTSNHVTCTYADGSYCVPCVLMAC